eukprot:gene16011-22148_t
MVKSEGEDYSYRLLISRKRPSTPARDNSTATEEELPLRSFLSSCGDLEKLQVLGLVNTMRPHLPGVEQLAEHTDDAPLPDFEKVLRLVSTMSPLLPGVEQLAMHTDHAPLLGTEFEKFVSKTMLTMISLGIRLAVPKELKKILKPRIVLKSKGSSAARNVGGQSLLTTEAMLEYDAQGTQENLEATDCVEEQGGSAARNVGEQSLLTTEAMLEYEWQVAMGGEHVVDMEAFKELVLKGKRLLTHSKADQLTSELPPTHPPTSRWQIAMGGEHVVDMESGV